MKVKHLKDIEHIYNKEKHNYDKVDIEVIQYITDNACGFKISELIETLQQIKEHHGDMYIEVLTYDEYVYDCGEENANTVEVSDLIDVDGQKIKIAHLCVTE